MDPKKWQSNFDKLEQEDNPQAKFLSDYVGMHSDHEEATQLSFAVFTLQPIPPLAWLLLLNSFRFPDQSIVHS